MLLGVDLGLLCSVVVVVVGWLVAQRKWRRAAARREEIRRLMALASEEAARAELEAVAAYTRIYAASLAPDPLEWGSSPGRHQFQYQCEMCFRPTTTRCKQCKSVHYCSRKCQVLHWREGHRDKCHSFTTNQKVDVGVYSSGKEFEQDGSIQNAIGIEEMGTTKPVESSSEICMFPNPNFHGLGENIDVESETSDNRKRADLNMKASIHSMLDECPSSTISIEMSVASDSNLKDYNRCNGQSTSMDVETMKPPLSGQPSLSNHEYGLAASSVSNQRKFGRIDTDEMSNSRSSYLPSSNRINIHVEKCGSGMNSVVAHDPCPATSTPKKSIALSEVSEDCLNSREPLSLSCTLPGQYGDGNTSTRCSSIEEAKLSSDACQEGTSERHGPSTPVVDVSGLISLAPKKLDNEIDEANVILHSLECQQNDSSRLSSTESHLSSSACTRKPVVQVLQSVENECTDDSASCSLDSSGYVKCATSGTNLSAVDQLRASNFVRHGSLGAGSKIMGRYEGPFPYELFVKLYNWNKVELSPCGLINCGNSCYANAVLQCLAFTPPLAAYCLQGLHAKTCKRKEWCFTCEFEVLVKKAKEDNNPVSPARIISQMQRMGSHLGNGREEDAHEFLRYAIDAMQSVCLKEAEVNVPSSLVEDTTLLGLTFGGYLQSKIECMRCGGKSKQHERIMDLTVEIEGEIGSLEDALLQFTHSEILDGENKYHCGRCKSYERAKKKLRVLEAPNVLVVALKRFQMGKFGKLNKAVKFPEILNLAPYMSGTSDKSPIYQLYGVVVHLDVMNAVFSGHYVCYIKNNQGRWFKADDSLVQVVELEKVLLNDAYILFYARCSPRAPRVIRSSMGPRDPRKAKLLTCRVKSHPVEPWDVSVGGLSGHASNGYFDRNYTGYHPTRSKVEEESLSEYSSSYFSEAGSYSTESSNRESVSTTDDILDQILGDMGNSWNRTWRSTSDSGTPLHIRRSPIADLDHCSSDAESSSSCSVNLSPKMDGDGLWAGASSKEEVLAGKGRGTFLCSSSNKECSRVSSSSRENDSNRLGSNNSFENVKGVYIRRYMR